MFLSSKMKVIAIAAIYVLHITFFDALMSHGFSARDNFGLATLSHHTHSNPDNSAESSYRLLTKHEQSKQLQSAVPSVFAFVFTTFTYITERGSTPIQLHEIYSLKADVFELYRIFRSFLI